MDSRNHPEKFAVITVKLVFFVARSMDNEKDAVQIRVKVVPRAKRDQISGVMQDGSLKIRLAAPPVDGKANQALVSLLEKTFDLHRGSVVISSGLHSRSKIVTITGLSSNEYQRFVESLE